ncbi:MAG: helix-turn-helix transcriptional regulator [Chloroflexi bacterium]|nr:helix-turn-helix transcriptional regulator [Chloroflexota bacterium]
MARVLTRVGRWIEVVEAAARLPAGAVVPRDLEIVLTLAYDRNRRLYVVISGDVPDAHPIPVDEATATALIDHALGGWPSWLPWRPEADVEVQQLNPRELLVLQGVAEGMTNRAIASRLRITENTTKRHLQSIFAKLGVSSRTQAAIVALSRGWVCLGPARVAT